MKLTFFKINILERSIFNTIQSLHFFSAVTALCIRSAYLLTPLSCSMYPVTDLSCRRSSFGATRRPGALGRRRQARIGTVTRKHKMQVPRNHKKAQTNPKQNHHHHVLTDRIYHESAGRRPAPIL